MTIRLSRAAPWILLTVTLATRAQTFGNPLLGFDEQFYLLVGDRMVHGGALPFVDIFDRKPVGLFLIYAAIRLLGGEGTLQYQLVAAAFVFAAAVVIARVGRRFAGEAGGLAAGVAYLIWLALLSGEGGQAPVFYNLPVLLAAAATMRLVEREGGPSIAQGAWPMLLVGLAMQIKYTALFEGVFFGLAMLGAGRSAGRSTGRSIIAAASWIAVALAPTLVAWAAYAVLGHGGEFVFANFVSQWGRLPDPLATSALGLLRIVGILAPLLLCAAFPPAEAKASRELRFIQLWLVAAIAGVLVMHGFPSPHYGLPLIAPGVLAAAPRLGDRRTRWVTALLLGVALIASQLLLASQRRARGGASDASRLGAVAAPRGGCLFVYDGPPALYRLTHSCLPSRFVFPGHLDTANEASAAGLGVDPVAETRRIMATRPASVMLELPLFDRGNRATLAIVTAELPRHYALAADVRTGKRHRLVYRRRD
jgi:hypothetical protein